MKIWPLILLVVNYILSLIRSKQESSETTTKTITVKDGTVFRVENEERTNTKVKAKRGKVETQP